MATTTRTTITGCVKILVCTITRRRTNSLRHFLEAKNLKTRRKRIPGSRQERTMDAERLLDEALDEECQEENFKKCKG